MRASPLQERVRRVGARLNFIRCTSRLSIQACADSLTRRIAAYNADEARTARLPNETVARLKQDACEESGGSTGEQAAKKSTTKGCQHKRAAVLRCTQNESRRQVFVRAEILN